MIITLMIIVFVLGYIAIALEHPLKIDKAASALIIGVVGWILFVFGISEFIQLEVFEKIRRQPQLYDDNFSVHHENPSLRFDVLNLFYYRNYYCLVA